MPEKTIEIVLFSKDLCDISSNLVGLLENTAMYENNLLDLKIDWSNFLKSTKLYRHVVEYYNDGEYNMDDQSEFGRKWIGLREDDAVIGMINDYAYVYRSYRMYHEDDYCKILKQDLDVLKYAEMKMLYETLGCESSDYFNEGISEIHKTVVCMRETFELNGVQFPLTDFLKWFDTYECV